MLNGPLIMLLIVVGMGFLTLIGFGAYLWMEEKKIISAIKRAGDWLFSKTFGLPIAWMSERFSSTLDELRNTTDEYAGDDGKESVMRERELAEDALAEAMNEGRESNDGLSPVERAIIEVIPQMEQEGLLITDELVAKRLPMVSPKTGLPYSRVHINRLRNKLRDMGYKV